jgi:sulfofructose kinase
LTKNKPIDLLTCGLLVADLKFQLANFPEKDQKGIAESFEMIPGGPATNAAITVNQLGGRAELIAMCGTDSLSKSIIQQLDDQGLSTSLIKTEIGGLSTAAVMTEHDGDRRVVSHRSSHRISALPKDATILNPTIMLFDGHELTAAENLMHIYPETTTILDAGSLHHGTEQLCSKVTWLIASKKFALQVTAKSDVESAIKILKDVNENIIVTCGKNGIFFNCGRSAGHVPAIKIDCIDSNGAGDVFHGAFAFGLARNFNLIDNLKFANAAAAISCTKPGIIGSIPKFAEVLSFLEKN